MKNSYTFLVFFVIFYSIESKAQLLFKAIPHIQKDSTKTNGLKVILKIDTLQKQKKDSGIKFSLSIENNRDTVVWIIPPTFDPMLDMGIKLENSKAQRYYLNSISRWHFENTNGLRSFPLPFQVDSIKYFGKKLPEKILASFIRKSNKLGLAPNQSIEYFLDVRNAHLKLGVDQAKLPIPKGIYSFEIDLWLRIIDLNYRVDFQQIRTKITLR